MPLPYHVPLPRSASVDLVREAMQRRRLSQRDLAAQLGLEREALARILAGKVPFPRQPALLTRLAASLGLDPAEFPEYRERLLVLPEATRRLVAHLEARGVDRASFAARVTRMNPETLGLLLGGGAPFPTDPRVIEDLAAAADTTPFLFPEYLPLERWRARLEEAARLALPPAAAAAFRAALAQLSDHLQALPEHDFDAQVVARMAGPAGEDPLGTLRAFLPRWDDLQGAVQQLLAGLERRGWAPGELARRSGVDEDELLSYLKGQLKLKDEDVRLRLMAALEDGDGQAPARG